MARTGRPRKAPAEAQGHRPHGALVPVEQLAPGVVEPIPPPPQTADGKPLQSEVLRLWDRFWLSRLKGALDGPDGVDRVNVDRWIRAEHELLVVEQAIQISGRLVKGSTGQPALNPLINYRRDLVSELRYFAEVLGLNPRDRARLGIDLAGAVSAEVRMNQILDGLVDGGSGPAGDVIEGDWAEAHS